jgi:hypothetical protein
MEAVIDRPVTDLRPWSAWPTPEFHVTNLHSLRVREIDGELVMMMGDDTMLGRTGYEGLREMSKRVGFDTAFIAEKVPADLAAQIINHRIRATNDTEVAVVAQNGNFTSFLPSAREMLTYAETAEEAMGIMTRTFGDGVAVDLAHLGGQGMRVRLMTDLQQPVTRSVGDTLSMGIDVSQEYGDTTRVELHLRRLICLNGMTSSSSAFSWQNRNEYARGRDAQRMWLANGIAEALGAYDEIVNRSRTMAGTRFEGDPREALRERARAMRFPMRFIDGVYRAFDEEPGDTEWALANAFTRIATHGALPGSLGRRVQGTIGEWTQGFDLVTARMPRPVAERVGAQIIEQIDSAGE